MSVGWRQRVSPLRFASVEMTAFLGRSEAWPACRAPCAGGGHFVTCIPLRVARPSGAKRTSFPTHRVGHAKPNTCHEVTALRAGGPSGRTCLWLEQQVPPLRFASVEMTAFWEERGLSCRTGPLRGGRSLRDGYTPSGGAPFGCGKDLLPNSVWATRSSICVTK